MLAQACIELAQAGMVLAHTGIVLAHASMVLAESGIVLAQAGMVLTLTGIVWAHTERKADNFYSFRCQTEFPHTPTFYVVHVHMKITVKTGS